MNRLRAENLLWWYYNEALVRSDISAQDCSATSLGLASWQCQDPNIAVAAKARPIFEALKRCSPRIRKILRLAFTEVASRYAPAMKAGAVTKAARRPRSVRFERLRSLVEVYGDKLAPLVECYQPEGDVGRKRVWAEGALRAALVTFGRHYDGA